MATKRDTRRRVAPGIYEDGDNYHATIHVRGAGFREKRFPINTPLPDVESWRNSKRIELLEIARRGSAPGTFRRDAQRYIRDFTPHLASAKSREIEVQTWIREFGEKRRGQITTADVARVRSKWLTEGRRDKQPGGLSTKTINNRVNTLRHLYHCLDGKKAWTPCDDLAPLEVHKTPIQFVADATIAAVDLKLQQLEREKRILSTRPRARFRVLVSTGRRPSELMRAQPTDVDLPRRIWLPRDGKGGFSPGIYLNDDMLAAWHFFITANAWGKFATDKQADYLRMAGWPADVRPYNARHTVGITLSERGVDLDDVGSMMGHKRRETTRRHYVPVLNSRMQKASELLNGRFAGWVQTEVQTSKAKSGKKRPNLKQSEQTAKPTKTTGKPRISSMKRRKR